ncbi:hypothetical protein T484DRAFT_1856550 [Baffinella frigidus]|nr:hypothetical protein T484DRAFT_1856550 [Cryptophyta sp. CCMP2293]
MAVSGIDGGLSAIATGQTVSVNRTGGTEVAVSTAFSFTLDVVRNRNSAGGTGLVSVRLYTGDGKAIDLDEVVPEVQIATGALSRALVAPLEADRIAFSPATFLEAERIAFSPATFLVSFGVSAVGIPASTTTAVVVTFPPGFNVSGASILASDFSFDGTLEASPNETASTVTITRSDGSAVPAYANISFAIRGVKTFYAGPSGTFQILTLLGGEAGEGMEQDLAITTLLGGCAGEGMEQDLAVPSFDVAPSAISLHGVTLSANKSGGNGDMGLDITLSSGLGLRSGHTEVLNVSLPSGFYFPAWPHTENASGPLLLESYTQEACQTEAWLQCTVLLLGLPTGETLAYGARFTVTFFGVRAQPFSGTTGAFSFATLETETGLRADEVEAPGIYIPPAVLANASVSASSYIANSSVSLTVRFTTVTVLASAFRMHLELPREYTYTTLPSVSAASIDGTFSLSTEPVSLQISRTTRFPQATEEQSGAIIVRRSAGTSLAPGTLVTITLGALLNAEVSGDTGTFSVSTETDGNVTVDASGALEGHALVYLPPEFFSLESGPLPSLGGATLTGHPKP